MLDIGVDVAKEGDSILSKKNDIMEREEIDLGLIFSIICRDRFLLVFICFLFMVVAYSVSLAFPDRYRASVILAPAQKEGGQLGGLASQYGGLAAMAGISLGKESDKTDQAIALLKSWPFIDYVVFKYDLSADVVAAKGFDKKGRRVIYDSTIYDEKNKEWVASEFRDTNGRPSSWMNYERFSKLLDVQNDKKTGLLTLTITHVSPDVAKSWLELLSRELNLYFQRNDKDDAKRNIDYLERKIAETPVAEMQNVFYSMVEAQTKVLMLAERSDDYLFKILVRPMVPEEKVSPKRFSIAIFGAVLGLLLGFFIVIFKYSFQVRRLVIAE